MSWFLFSLVIDQIMKRTVEGANVGIRWKLWSKLDDLDFAGDTALTFSTKCQIQEKVENLSLNSNATALKINSEKTELLRLNTTSNKQYRLTRYRRRRAFCVLGCKH